MTMTYPHGGYASGREMTDLPVVPEGPVQGADGFVQLPSMACPGCGGWVIRATDDAACNTPDCVYYHGGIVKAWEAIAEISANPLVADFNAERKRHAGIRDQGLCPCDMYFKMSCRTYCLKTGERHEG